MTEVANPIGAQLPTPIADAPAESFEDWQEDRWAVHGDLNVPESGKQFEHVLDDGSFHALSVGRANQDAQERLAARRERKRRIAPSDARSGPVGRSGDDGAPVASRGAERAV